MFKKIIIAEDHEIRNLGVINTLKDLKIQDYEFVSYCDDALRKIKTAISQENPYDLLITDLSFDEDHHNPKITSGKQLIEEVRKIQPKLKIIAFSIEKKTKIIEELFTKHEINGFVSKGRNDAKELKTTMKKVFKDEIVIPQEILNSIRNNAFEFTDYDLKLLELLAKGYSQLEIMNNFKTNNLIPNGKSSIEKHLNELRETLGARNNVEMIVICKDSGIL